jgi:hypothetical protein
MIQSEIEAIVAETAANDEDPRKALHGRLQIAVLLLAASRPYLVPISTDTAVALGEAMGALGKAKALVGRDIDDAAARQAGPHAV